MSFKDEPVGISEYIWQTRLEKCRRELETAKINGRSVTDIAFSWGFSSSSHFCRLFKQKYGAPASSILRG
jgi:AraC-like DNA-binding protein